MRYPELPTWALSPGCNDTRGVLEIVSISCQGKQIAHVELVKTRARLLLIPCLIRFFAEFFAAPPLARNNISAPLLETEGGLSSPSSGRPLDSYPWDKPSSYLWISSLAVPANPWNLPSSSLNTQLYPSLGRHLQAARPLRPLPGSGMSRCLLESLEPAPLLRLGPAAQ